MTTIPILSCKGIRIDSTDARIVQPEHGHTWVSWRCPGCGQQAAVAVSTWATLGLHRAGVRVVHTTAPTVRHPGWATLDEHDLLGTVRQLDQVEHHLADELL